MGIKKYKPTSDGRRHGSSLDWSEITSKKPEKSLLVKIKKTGGRNNLGRITARHRGGGHKPKYRIIDFRRNKDNVPAKVATIEYDPNRTANIALLHYADGEKRYILAPKDLEVGQQVFSGEKVEPKSGNCMPLKSIPTGLPIHNIEMRPGQGGLCVRSAGVNAQLMAKDGNYATVSMPSGEIRLFHINCRATIGQVGNLDHQNVKIGKAGRKRWMGRRPIVRGTVMNPVAHPMGGGEGKSSGGRHPCGPTGVLSKGGKTRNRRKLSNKHIVRRRKKK